MWIKKIYLWNTAEQKFFLKKTKFFILKKIPYLRWYYRARRKSNLFFKIDKAVTCRWNFWIREFKSYVHVARSLVPQWNKSRALIHHLIYFYWYNQWLFHWFRFRVYLHSFSRILTSHKFLYNNHNHFNRKHVKIKNICL